MKYFIVPIILLFLLPNMTNSANHNDIPSIINTNRLDYFSVTKEQAAFLSFDISSVIPNISETENIVLSLFLESKKDSGDTSKFIIYPVDRVSRKVGPVGLLIEVKTRQGNFVDFVIPPKLLEGIENPLGFVIQTNQESTFIFKGADEIGTTHDPRLTIEEGEANISEESFVLPEESKVSVEQRLAGIEKYAKAAAENSEPKWWENSKVQLLMLLGAIAGIIALVLQFIIKK